jgi:hypothetical protein
MEYSGAEMMFWSLFAAQFGEEFGEVFHEMSIRPLAEDLSPNRFWKPGRGQNEYRKLTERRESPIPSSRLVYLLTISWN